MKALKLNYTRVKQINPRIVMTSISLSARPARIRIIRAAS